MTKDKLRKLIWAAIQNHFTLTDTTRLETSLKYEKNKTIAQVIAIGLCVQYDIDVDTVQKVLCIEPVGYKNKLDTFNEMTHRMSGVITTPDEDLVDFKRRYSMCSRYVRRRTTPYYSV